MVTTCCDDEAALLLPLGGVVLFPWWLLLVFRFRRFGVVSLWLFVVVRCRLLVVVVGGRSPLASHRGPPGPPTASWGGVGGALLMASPRGQPGPLISRWGVWGALLQASLRGRPGPLCSRFAGVSSCKVLAAAATMSEATTVTVTVVGRGVHGAGTIMADAGRGVGGIGVPGAFANTVGVAGTFAIRPFLIAW